MLFIETSVFTRQVMKQLSDESLREMQSALLFRPEHGVLVPGGAGLRKLRWKAQGTGKRGGIRVLYLWDKPAERIYFLFLYAKAHQGDLTQKQIQVLAKLIREELK